MKPTTSILRKALGFVSLMVLAASPLRAQAFNHPGILHTQADFDRMSQKIATGEQPWQDGWNKLFGSPYAQSGWTPRATSKIIRGSTGENVALLYNDVARAYQCALVWKVTGSTAHGDTARDILNDWSSTLVEIGDNTDKFLAGGLNGYQLANAAEMMRGYPGFDVTRMQNMLLMVFYYPINECWLYGNSYGNDHADACDTKFWANWDLCNMASAMAIAIFCEDRAIYNRVVDYFKTGTGNGSIGRAVPFLHGSDLGQWQESGRDQEHSILGVGLMASFCEMAWNQGDDLYSWDDNRFRKGAEYVARYNLGYTVPFTTYRWGDARDCHILEQTVISTVGRGARRPIWEMIYHHYVVRMGQSAPGISEMAASVRTENGPVGEYPSTFDQPGHGTLTHSLTPTAGIYRLKSRASGKYLDNLGSTSNGTNVAQWQGGSSNNQKWSIISDANGYRKLSCVTGNRMLDSIGNTADGSTCAQWVDSTSTNQQWTLRDFGNGYFKVVNRANGKCLDTAGSSTNGAPMKFYSNGASNNQQWTLELDSIYGPESGGYRLKNRGSGKYLDNLGSTTDGSEVIQWASGASDNQKLTLSVDAAGFYKLAFFTGGKMLDSVGHTIDGSTCGQWGGGSSPNQQWTLHYLGTGYYKLINRGNGKCLDADGNSTNGAKMEFWPSSGSLYQQWAFEPL
jgi:hypothetical protein